jgi:hypothetical protein
MDRSRVVAANKWFAHPFLTPQYQSADGKQARHVVFVVFSSQRGGNATDALMR